MNTIKLTRQELFEMVWEKPFSTLSKEIGVSDVAIRKKCINNKIPIPKQGHWMKAKYGRAPAKPKK